MSFVVLLGSGKVKRVFILVLYNEHFFVLLIMGIILMVASLVIVDFDIKKKNQLQYMNLFLSFLLLQSFWIIRSFIKYSEVLCKLV